MVLKWWITCRLRANQEHHFSSLSEICDFSPIVLVKKTNKRNLPSNETTAPRNESLSRWNHIKAALQARLHRSSPSKKLEKSWVPRSTRVVGGVQRLFGAALKKDNLGADKAFPEVPDKIGSRVQNEELGVRSSASKPRMNRLFDRLIGGRRFGTWLVAKTLGSAEARLRGWVFKASVYVAFLVFLYGFAKGIPAALMSKIQHSQEIVTTVRNSAAHEDKPTSDHRSSLEKAQ